MEKRELTCIVCPRGCKISVTFSDDGKIEKIVGNSCPRGEKYAKAECTHPERTVTSTVRTQSGEIVPVKTDRAIPKELVFDAMKVINRTHPKGEVAIGDILLENIVGTDANLVVTGKASK